MTMLPDIDENAYDDWEKQRLSQQLDQKVSSFTLEHALDSRISELSAFTAPPSSDSLTNPLGAGNASPATEPAAPELAPPQPVEQMPPPAPPTPPQEAPAAPSAAPTEAPSGGIDNWLGAALGAVKRAGGDVQKFADGINVNSADLAGNALGAANRAGADLQAFAASLPPLPVPPPSQRSPIGPTGGPPLPQGDLVDYARQQARRYGVDEDVFVRQIQQESGFSPTAKSGAGATGIAQFMPDTARGMGVDPSDPYQSLDGAARLMASHLKDYNGDYAKALAAYNAGPGNVAKYGGVPPFEETQRYVKTILGGAGQAVKGAAAAVGGAIQGAAQGIRQKAQDISQFGSGQLSSDEAYAACGPAAAVRFASMYGRNPTLREATDLASQVGWTPGSGMAGLGSEKALMDKLGVPTKMIAGAQWDQFAREAQSGNPVTISTPGHYYFADGFDPTSGAFHVGRSGTDLKGGSEWMTPQQMEARMGQVQGGLLADNPQVPAPSIADRDTNPVSYLGRMKDTLGSSITSGAPPPDLTDINGRLTSAATGVNYKAPLDLASGDLQAASVGEPTAITAPASPVDKLKSAFGDFIDSLGGGAKSATDALGSAAGNLVASPGGGLPGGSQPLPSDSLTNPIGSRYPAEEKPAEGPTGLPGLLDRLGQGLPDITGVADVKNIPGVPFIGESGAQSPVGRIAQGQTLSPTEQLQAFPQELIAMSSAHDEAAKALDPFRDVPIVGSVLEQSTNPLTWVGASGAKSFAGAAGALASSTAAAKLAETLVAPDDPNREAKIALATLVGGLPGAAAGERVVSASSLDAAFEAIDRARPPTEAYARTGPPPPPPSAAPPPPPAGGGTSRLKEIRDMFAEQDKQPALIPRLAERAAEILGLGGRTGELDTAAADRFAAINQMTGRARQALGSAFTPDMDAEAYTAAYMGRGGRAEQLVKDEVKPAIDLVRANDDVENLNVYRKAQRDMEVANLRGGTRTASAGVDSAATAQATLDELQAEVGPERWKTIQQADDMLGQAQERLLQKRVDAGLIDQDLADQLMRDHPHYNPTVVMKYADDSGVSGGRTTLQTTANKVRQLAEDGSADDTEKPLRSLIRHFVENDVLVNRNETAQAIIRAAQADPELAGLVKKAPVMRRVTGPEVAGPGGAASTPGGMASVMQRRFGDQPGEMSVYENGKRVYYSIPDGLEAAVKGLDAQTSGTFEKIMSKANSPLRWGATAASPAFAVTNALADAVTTYVREGAKTTAGIPKGWWDAARQNDVYKDYVRAGGSMESLFQKSPQDLDKLVEDSGGMLARNPSDITRIAKDAASLQFIRRAGEVIEQGPRLAAFKRHLNAGESPTQAAVAGRRATVDFARGGDAIRQANAVSLFLNARVQGGLNVARTLRDDPGSRARAASLAAMTAGAYAYNRQYPEYWDVPREVRDNSMVFMLPGSEKDPSGTGYKRLNYISVPLREWSAFTAPVNYALAQIDKEHGSDPRTWQDFAKGEAGTLSPVAADDTGAGVSGLLPAPARYLVENATNTRLRSGTPIVPTRYQNLPPSQQWDERTSKLGRKLGETLGISPMGFDFAVNENIGGLGRTALGATDQVTDWVTKARGGEVPTTGQETPPVIGGLTSGVIRTYGGQMARDKYEKLDQLVGQFQEPAAAAIRDSPVYQTAPRDLQDAMVRIGQDELKAKFQEELNIQPTARDLGLPQKYLGVDDPQEELQVDAAISKYNAWQADPRHTDRPDSDELRQALRYKDRVNPRYTFEKKKMDDDNADVRLQIRDYLATQGH